MLKSAEYVEDDKRWQTVVYAAHHQQRTNDDERVEEEQEPDTIVTHMIRLTLFDAYKMDGATAITFANPKHWP